MNATDLINAFGLPAGAYVNKRVPKKLLVENGAPTTGDVHKINNGIGDLYWVAALKPATIGIAAYSDDTREILEIMMLSLTLRESVKAKRLNELVHRAVPYPVVLITTQDSSLTLSLAQKRRSQAETGKIVIEGEVIEVHLNNEINKNFLESFLQSLILADQCVKTLFELYEGWIDIMLTLQAAHFTGSFTKPSSVEQATMRREALKTCIHLISQMEILRTAAKKETQLARQVDLNLKLERLKADYANACARL